jgi:hypothetical protein
MRRCAGLQLDEPGLGLSPYLVGRGNPSSYSARLACVGDRMLERPASRRQGCGMLLGGQRRVPSPLALVSEAITFGSLTVRRLLQQGGELLDRVSRFESR